MWNTWIRRANCISNHVAADNKLGDSETSHINGSLAHVALGNLMNLRVRKPRDESQPRLLLGDTCVLTGPALLF